MADLGPVKDMFAGFSMVSVMGGAFDSVIDIPFTQLNLKNDLLRRRFDSLKYDIKKIEEGKRVLFI
jgi:Translin family